LARYIASAVEVQRVAARAPHDRFLAQDAAQSRDRDLKRIRRVRRQRVAPQRLDRHVRRDGVRAVDEQQREQLQRPPGARQRLTAGPDRLERPEDAELHGVDRH
jgi:hypothetical protein